jgi:DNA polymerase-3 subunit chi
VRTDFYHLVASPLENVLPRICERILAEGQRLILIAEPSRLDLLDEQLWSYSRGAFLPHGRAGEPYADRQPLLLSVDTAALNGARNVALTDGRWRDEALAFDRIFYFFDESRLEGARASWRALKDRLEVERHYWKQDDRGKWVEGP